MRPLTPLNCAALLALAGCGDKRGDSPFDSNDGGGDGISQSAGDDGDGGDGSATGATTGADGGDDGGPKLDVGAKSDLGGLGCQEGEDCGCTFVDLVFVVDNSGSMGDYQSSLAIAFPAFADTLNAALPPGTNVHVGVTSTEMGFSGSGATTQNNGMCTFIGDNNQPNDFYYVTPDVTNSGRNGAQGRLYDPGGGETFHSFDIGGDPSGLAAWFSSAVQIGTGGSNIEMSCGPVGWVVDPVNDATNAGFLRDEGAVLVVFFMQDEPDQTPMVIDGKAGGQFVLDKVAAAKSACGGLDCVIAGGFLNAQACSADGNLPLDDFLAGMVQAPVVQALPPENLAETNPQAAADEMNNLLSDTLADVIAQTCESIPPAP